MTQDRLRTAAAASLGLVLAACVLGTSTENPVPRLVSLSPAEVQVGRAQLKVLVSGTEFVPGAVVRMEGITRPTRFLGDTLLETTLDFRDVSQVGSLRITVLNPTPGGGESEPLLFRVTPTPAPVPLLHRMDPRTAPAGSDSVRIHLEGDRLTADTEVHVDGEAVPVSTALPFSREATLPARMLQTPGTREITLFTPPPGGGRSSSLLFTVFEPAP